MHAPRSDDRPAGGALCVAQSSRVSGGAGGGVARLAAHLMAEVHPLPHAEHGRRLDDLAVLDLALAAHRNVAEPARGPVGVTETLPVAPLPPQERSRRDALALERKLAYEETKVLRRRRSQQVDRISRQHRAGGRGNVPAAAPLVAVGHFGRAIEVEDDRREWWSHQPALAAEEERQRQLECQARLSACADGAVAAPTPRLCGHAQATPAGSFAHSPHVRVQSRVLPQHRLSVLACPCCVGSDVSLAQAGPTRTS